MPLISTSAIVHPNPNGAIDGLLPEDNGLMKIVGGLSLYLLLVGLQIGQLSGKCRDPFHTGGRKDFRRGPSENVRIGHIFDNNRDREFFKGILIPQTCTNGVLRSAQLKRMYLRIMSYGKEVLEQDWSEFPVPDFNSLARLSEAPATKSENLGLFSGIVVYAARHVPVLKVEIDCLLVSMPANEFEQLQSKSKSVHFDQEAVIVTETNGELSPKSPTMTDISVTSLDIESEYKALQVLFDAISSEAETLRDQLEQTKSKIPAMQTVIETLQQENQELANLRDEAVNELEAMVLSKANAMAESAKESDNSLRLVQRIREHEPGVTNLDDIAPLLEKMLKENSDQRALFFSLQTRCEEAEIARDVLIEKEKILLEERREWELKIEQSLMVENELIPDLQLKVTTIEAERQKLCEENLQLRIRISQKEDEVMQVENERKELAKNMQNLGESHQEECLRLSQGRLKLEREYTALEARYAETTCSLFAQVEELTELTIVMNFRQAKLKSKLSNTRTQVTALKGDNLQLWTHRSKLRKRLRKLWPRYHALKKLVGHESDAKILSLKQLNEEMEMMLEVNSEEIATLQGHLKEKSTQASVLETEKQSLITEVNGKEKELCAIRIEIKDLQTKNEKDRSDLETAKEQLISENAELRRANRLNQGRVVELEDELRINEISRGKITQSWEQESTRNEEAHKIEIKRLNDKIRELRELSMTFEEENAKSLIKIQKDKSLLDDECRALRDTIKDMHKEKELLDDEYRTLKDTAKDLSRDKTMLNDECRTLQDVAKVLNSEKESLESKFCQMDKERSELTEQARRLESALEALLASKEDVEENLQLTLNEANAHRELSCELREKTKSLSLELEECQRDLKSTRDKLTAQENSSLVLREELDHYKTELESAGSQASEAQTFKSRLEEIILQNTQDHELNILELKQHLTGEIAERNSTISELSSQLENLRSQIGSKELEWANERTKLANWLQEQEKELQRLAVETVYKPPHEDSACQTHLCQSTVAIVTEDLDLIDRRTLDIKDKEISKMKAAMKEMLKSIREEHQTILTVWHNLGSRIYRDSFYQRF